MDDGINLSMPVQPAYGGGYGNNGGFGFGGDWAWIILLLLCSNGGWGGFGGGWGGMGGMMGFGIDFPWLMNGQQQISNNTNDGFRDAQLHDSITSVGDRLASLSTQLCDCCGQTQMSIANSTAALQNSLCNGFNGVNTAISGAQNAISNQLYSNEIASLNRSFAEQTANAQGFNGVQSGLCDIRYGNATNTREIISAVTAGVQSIKDQLCADKLSAKDDIISQLRQENLYARGQASQIAQNSAIINGIYDRLNQCPVGTVPVFGEQPIFTCPTNVGNNCGCGCNGGNF